MAKYIDNSKTDLAALTWVTKTKWHGGFRVAGGAPVSSTFLPVTGHGDYEDQLAAAKDMMSFINPYTDALIGNISQIAAANSDNDVPAKYVGANPSCKLFFEVTNSSGSVSLVVVIKIPYFKPATDGTDAAAVLAVQLEPKIRVFGTDDRVVFQGSKAG